MDRLPGPFQLLYRDTRVFVLRLIGRRTEVSSAATISLVLAMSGMPLLLFIYCMYVWHMCVFVCVSAAISEELLFRGLLTTHWTQDFGALPCPTLPYPNLT